MTAAVPSPSEVAEALAWLRENPSYVDDLADTQSMAQRAVATVARAALAAGPDERDRELAFLRTHAETLQDSVERAWSVIPEGVEGEDDSLASHIVAALAGARPATDHEVGTRPSETDLTTIEQPTDAFCRTCTVIAGPFRPDEASAWVWGHECAVGASARSAGDDTAATYAEIHLPEKPAEAIAAGRSVICTFCGDEYEHNEVGAVSGYTAACNACHDAGEPEGVQE